jgi:hypothetical protein
VRGAGANDLLDEGRRPDYHWARTELDNAKAGEKSMSYRPTPPLSPEGVREIARELDAPPADTPQRRSTFVRARAAAFLVRQVLLQTGTRHSV